jgi:hypothetical protein
MIKDGSERGAVLIRHPPRKLAETWRTVLVLRTVMEQRR